MTSKKERRIVVTNDEDFIEFTREDIFGVIWLRIPQNDPVNLVTSFDRLLHSVKAFTGRLIVLRKEDWDNFPLGELVDFKG